MSENTQVYAVLTGEKAFGNNLTQQKKKNTSPKKKENSPASIHTQTLAKEKLGWGAHK